ncbi:hypothetical protein LCM20_09475 [Halobacillus litoralis]|uniref:hypothetical protein n=1 Tax=Halobacillus litoralis TaxID=45668 RepID=UPI001CD2738C|nr:hypothetical protein [Halobacillus litoralis]MCA0970819.1 hypothetical protein [Halobacillus litoralis]
MLHTFSMTGILILLGAVTLAVLLLKKMKHRYTKIALALVAVAFLFFGLITINKPLESFGHSFNGDHPTIIVATIDNVGYTNLTLRDITVNEGDRPKEVRLLTSTANAYPNVADWENRAEGVQDVQFEAYQGQTIPRTPEKYYSIGIEHDQPIEKVNVTYTYLGLPFEQVIEHGEAWGNS